MNDGPDLRLVSWWNLPQTTAADWAHAAGDIARAAAVAAPGELFGDLARVCAGLVGWKLFTVLAIDHRQRLARRFYTSDPASYPIGGAKSFYGSELGATAFTDGRAFIARDHQELTRVFPDHELISRLGCGAALNVPVRHHGRVVGSVNILDVPNSYSESDAALIGPLAQYCAATLAEIAVG